MTTPVWIALTTFDENKKMVCTVALSFSSQGCFHRTAIVKSGVLSPYGQILILRCWVPQASQEPVHCSWNTSDSLRKERCCWEERNLTDSSIAMILMKARFHQELHQCCIRTSWILTWTTWSWVKTCFSSKPSRLLSPLCATTLGPQGKVGWKQVTIWLTGANEYVHQDSPCLSNCHRVYEIWKPSINGPWTWQYLRRHLVAAVDTRHKPQPTFTLNCTGIHVLSHIMLLTYETTTGDPDPIHSVSCGFQFQRHVKLFGTSGGKNSQCNEFSLEGYTFIWRFNCRLSQCHSSKPYE